MIQFNKEFLSQIDSPYDHSLITNEIGCEYIENTCEKLYTEYQNDKNLYIIDNVPHIYENFRTKPNLLIGAVFSPTFAVSLVDSKAYKKGTLEKWYTFMYNLHNSLLNAIETKKCVKITSEELAKVHDYFNTYRDVNYISNIYRPWELYFAVALMDVYHLFHNYVKCNYEHFDYVPLNILNVSNMTGLKTYLTNYS